MRRLLCRIGLHRWVRATKRYRKSYGLSGVFEQTPSLNEEWSVCSACGKEKTIWRAPSGDLTVANLEEMVQAAARTEAVK